MLLTKPLSRALLLYNVSVVTWSSEFDAGNIQIYKAEEDLKTAKWKYAGKLAWGITTLLPVFLLTGSPLIMMIFYTSDGLFTAKI